MLQRRLTSSSLRSHDQGLNVDVEIAGMNNKKNPHENSVLTYLSRNVDINRNFIKKADSFPVVSYVKRSQNGRGRLLWYLVRRGRWKGNRGKEETLSLFIPCASLERAVDDGARKLSNRPMADFWVPEVTCGRSLPRAFPSSIDVRVLLLNQPN